jgi:hypothetical protein
MLDPENIPAVEDNELLARYITQSSQFRPSDKQVKPSLFIPHLHKELSVSAKPLSNNPNHANIEGWPTEKEEQKAIALKLAAVATKLISPPLKTADE